MKRAIADRICHVSCSRSRYLGFVLLSMAVGVVTASSSPRMPMSPLPVENNSPLPVENNWDDLHESKWFQLRFRLRRNFLTPLNHRRHQNINKRVTAPKKKSQGSFVGFSKPTEERVSQWFGLNSDNVPGEVSFNHDSVGMTNPYLHVTLPGMINNLYSRYNVDFARCSSSSSSSSSSTKTSEIREVSMKSSKPVLLRNRERSVEDVHQAWWPRGVIELQQQASKQPDKQKSTLSSSSSCWRQLRYCRCVGNGEECYRRVRDAALDWKFLSSNQKRGIISVGQNAAAAPSHLKRRRASHDVLSHPDNGQQQQRHHSWNVQSSSVQSLWAGPHQNGRRLVTFTSLGRSLFKLYAMNPVMVVYDLMDQRGPQTTYTSTAYATLMGHWLSGEERVTVAIRDGSGDVDVEIISFSRAAPNFFGKLVWPLIGPMQNQFFHQQLDYLERTASSSSTGVVDLCK